MSSEVQSSTSGLRSMISRGESLVATSGLAFVAILAFVVGAMIWVSAKTVDESRSSQVVDKLRSSSSFIAAQAEVRLNEGDLSGLRRLMLDAVASNTVSQCDVILPNGDVIASSNPSSVTVSELPEDWANATQVSNVLQINESTGEVLIEEPLIVYQRDGIVMRAISAVDPEVSHADSIRFSSFIIACAGLVCSLFVYRRLRFRLGALAAIKDALRVASQGERRRECLLVGDSLGPEARTWNALLDERDRLEEQLVDQEIEYRSGEGVVESVGLPAACNTLTSGVILVESDSRIVYANGAACVFLKVDKDEFTNTDISSLDGFEELTSAIQTTLENQSASRQVIEIESELSINEGGSVFRVMITRVNHDGMPRAMVFIEDVTQQRLSDQMQDAFIAQATHELRTPLTTIRLYTEEAVDAGSDDETTREQALNIIQSEVRRLERVVGDMLSVSEIEAGSLSIRSETVRTESLFQDLEQDYQAQAKEKSIELVFDLPPKFPSISADRDRINQTLHNLIGNAIKYTPSGGKVEVQAEFGVQGSMTVKVSDSGIGIDPSQHERIFERFSRAEDRRISQVTGSGLGLAIARDIARLHGGDITVESMIDQGSIFTLFIPGSQELSQAA